MQRIFACCILFTTAMAFIPITDIPNIFNMWDKLKHALAFTTLTITGSFAYPRHTKVVYAGLILYGAAIEVMQGTLTTTHIGDVSDLLADSIGVATGFAVYFIVRKISKHHA